MKTKIALVSGGTGGIGAAICRHLARVEYNVLVGYRSRKDEAEEFARAIGGRAIECVIDDSASLHHARHQIDRLYGRLDLLVNNAGMTKFVAHADLDGLGDALFDQIMAVNVRGAFASVRAFQPLLNNVDQSVIINISSVAARTGLGSNVAYCASKAAVDSLTRSLARALAPRIRVISVAPGLVDTDFVKNLDPAWRREQESRTPLGRLSRPEEVAEAVVAAATMLSFSTGSIISVDGGRPLN